MAGECGRRRDTGLLARPGAGSNHSEGREVAEASRRKDWTHSDHLHQPRMVERPHQGREKVRSTEPLSDLDRQLSELRQPRERAAQGSERASVGAVAIHRDRPGEGWRSAPRKNGRQSFQRNAWQFQRSVGRVGPGEKGGRGSRRSKGYEQSARADRRRHPGEQKDTSKPSEPAVVATPSEQKDTSKPSEPAVVAMPSEQKDESKPAEPVVVAT